MNIVDEIKGKVTLEDVISHFGGAELTGNGSALVGWHKAHESTSKRSLHVDLDSGLYHCKSCGEGGDLFDWAGHVRFNSTWNNRDRSMFTEVLREVAQFANVDMPDADPVKVAERRGIEELFQMATEFYHAQLTPERREYFHARGFTDETINAYRLGYAPAGGQVLWSSLLEQNIDPADLLKTGLFRKHESGNVEDLFQGRFLFPYIRHGRTAYFIGRITDESPAWEQERGMKYCKLLVHSEKNAYVSDQVENRYFYGEDSVKRGSDLLITEGVADCLSALQSGLACVSPGTVQFAEKDHAKILELAQRAGTVYICNDNEVSKAGSNGTLATARMLWKHGKVARLVELPRPEGVDKIDLNDFLNTHEPEAFKALLPKAKTLLDLTVDKIAQCDDDDDQLIALQTEALDLIAQVENKLQRERWRGTMPKKLGLSKSAYDSILGEVADSAQDDAQAQESAVQAPEQYKVVNGAICMWNSDSGLYRELCNFDARITADVTMDDGQTKEKFVEINGKLANGGTRERLLMPAVEFGQMNWHMKSWGPRCRVGTANNTLQHLRYAIQSISEKDMTDKTIYTHTGWRMVNGKRIFLHGGGAVGDMSVEVKLGGRLADYILPADDDQSVSELDAMIASLETLELGDHEVTFPIFAAIYLGPLTEIIEEAFTLWVEGETGAGKSSITSRMLNHFGGTWNYKRLPTNWETTANELEHQCFEAKDLPLVIDDYRPATDKLDDADMRKKAQRILRAVGNRAGRGRMTYGNNNKRPTYDPRGAVIATAELNTGGHSALARQLVVKIFKGMTKLEQLKRMPIDTRLPYAMRGFIKAIAANWDEMVEAKNATELEWHGKAKSEHHGRVPGATLNLYCAFALVLWYAETVGAINAEQSAAYKAEMLQILDSIACGQQNRLEREKPSYRFVSALASLLIQRKVLIASRGTDETGFGATNATKIGWHDSGKVMLMPDVTVNMVTEFYSKTSQPFVETTATMGEALNNAKLLVKTQGANLGVKTRIDDGTSTRLYFMSLERIMDEVNALGGRYDDIAITKATPAEGE